MFLMLRMYADLSQAKQLPIAVEFLNLTVLSRDKNERDRSVPPADPMFANLHERCSSIP